VLALSKLLSVIVCRYIFPMLIKFVTPRVFKNNSSLQIYSMLNSVPRNICTTKQERFHSYGLIRLRRNTFLNSDQNPSVSVRGPV
jgi:hypothetical protein